MCRAAHAVESKAVVRIEVAVENIGMSGFLFVFVFLPGGLLHKQGPRRARLRAAPLPHSHNALLATSGFYLIFF
jgi:hypothetical protein